MRTIRLTITFYRSFVFLSVLISLACGWIIHVHGLMALSGLLGLKIFTLLIIVLFINTYKKRDYFYYQNLGMSRTRIWKLSLLLDMSIFLFIMIMGVTLR